MPLDFEHMNLLDELNATSKMPELLQETHACFLSLIRDILCSTPDHRMSLEELKRKVNFWLLNPITPLNEWYHQSENWLHLLPSAVFFLTGEFTDQPEDFVPYLEYKVHLSIYQWIGAGRDTDNNLVPLCNYWLSRRNDMGTNRSFVPINSNFLVGDLMGMNSKSDESSSLDRSISPLPARFPTEWTVTKATSEEIEEFQEQERRRYESPHMSFTYYQHDYESVVGPVKGIYTQQVLGITKARGHNMLVANRPNFVTILTLVRDAAARLPNGEGTRAEICELLKSSQYINPTASDQVLQTIVSGALDRMHTEPDPCVKYDSKRKIWIYLHRNRSESEFEKMHLQQQCVIKPKKIICKKTKSKSDKLVHSNTSCTPSLTTLFPKDAIVEKATLTVDASNPGPAKTAIHNFISQSSPNISPQIVSNKNIEVAKVFEPSSIGTSSLTTFMNNKNLTLPIVSNKTNIQGIVTTKIPIQQKTISPSGSSQLTSKSSFLSKVTPPQSLPNNKKNKAPETTSLHENKIILQNDLSELGKIGIIPQKMIQVSPNRFQTSNKGNCITLNKTQSVFITEKHKQLMQPKFVQRSDAINAIKIPISLTNYTTDLNQKIIQVKPVGGIMSSMLSPEGLSTLRRANFQVIFPTFF